MTQTGLVLTASDGQIGDALGLLVAISGDTMWPAHGPQNAFGSDVL